MSRILMLGAAFCAAVGLLGGQQPCLRASEKTAERKIEEALASPTVLEFQETPLQDVVDYLKHYHEINIQFDEKAMNDVGVATDTAITRELKNISLRSALELVLPELDLTYLVENEVLLITTEEEAGSEEHMLTKVYPVADLITRVPVPPGAESPWEPADYDSMIEMITSTVAPTTWDHVGGPGAIAPGTFNNVETLVISQTYHVHRKIAALLEELRRVAGVKQQAVAQTAEQKIEAALGSPTKLEFIETPLGDVVDFLEDHYGIEIQIDTKALADVGIATDTPITKSPKGISLRSALRLMLRELDLTYVIQDEVLLITTEKE